MTAPSRLIATTPSSGTLNGREPGTAAGEVDELGDPLGFREERAASEPVGEPLALVMVVPNGVGDGPGETELPGTGVGVPGTAVGLGVGLAVGTGVGTGVGAGVGGGVGAVTTTWPGTTKGGFVGPVLVDWYVTVQLPAGNVDEPVQVPFRAVPENSDNGTAPPATDALTVTASSVTLPTKCTEN